MFDFRNLGCKRLLGHQIGLVSCFKFHRNGVGPRFGANLQRAFFRQVGVIYKNSAL